MRTGWFEDRLLIHDVAIPTDSLSSALEYFPNYLHHARRAYVLSPMTYPQYEKFVIEALNSDRGRGTS